ncbi:oxaloacetate decarboxylase subunit alpha [Legionella taurinensis]|uniref:Oxaloacetate decarboxylase subunit alpha n=1 Tax=Legionella taurinensis TaxID=70611 RepID=A0AB38N5A1_9GAMM|nr:sodium-extruding oxaloacetate decarboxylase subunit alpha [Legionella taurinensis]MDX1837679.1 sodium-extruding oxaloacetate decarboxylase subunit alpha [Legionella taurinensis]PUT39964.1 oxaloacetate decarboxylase subunit alpha [Legionella taurinensis]PUT43730.1 oxaloacetate decarboxylase subunit alpha [Legionella taurinensis]PUT46137.1 oxaloacetate decarboxylase subunit alpha [Legionella taurinensis]PUT47885.1 oxaloacetate decarboxylase subunit alpha [Legionella taurinensis]
MATTHITDVTLRDAHQCLIATRLRTDDMLPVCRKMDEVGFWAMEVWGGATFDACLRFLKEDPWQRLRLLRNALPNTRLSMLLRGQNLLGYRHYADDVVDAFIGLAANNGVDVFRVFDALNDVRNLRVPIASVKRHKRHAQGAICYTTSPVHTLANFVDMGKALADLGCDSLAIKDMAGLLTPSATVELFTALAEATGLPVHLHTHATSGLAAICHYQAVLAGCQHIDTAISSFSGGASHPAAEPLVAALAGTEFDTGLDLNLLLEIGDYFHDVRKKYQQFESEARDIDPRVQLYQVPGGMISNLYSQLKEQQALGKVAEVHQEIPRVRKDLGYPPLVTPTSQIVGTQAVMNVLTGERYKTITNEVKLYCQGKYGAAPGKINPRVLKKAIGQTEIIDVRPADLIPNELARLRSEIGGLALCEEDVLSFAMFPEIGRQFLKERQDNALTPEPLISPDASQNNELSEFDIILHGENYHVKVAGYGTPARGQQSCFLWVDGVPEEVIIQHDDREPNEPTAIKKTTGPGDIKVAMPGTIVSIQVAVGDRVKAGQALFVLEAMKMETEIQAPFAGTVAAVWCAKGDKVTPADTLMELQQHP